MRMIVLKYFQRCCRLVRFGPSGQSRHGGCLMQSTFSVCGKQKRIPEERLMAMKKWIKLANSLLQDYCRRVLFVRFLVYQKEIDFLNMFLCISDHLKNGKMQNSCSPFFLKFHRSVADEQYLF